MTSITPNTGTANGGTGVTIAGTGFQSGATVFFGGTAATGVTVVSSTSITATTPAHAAGVVSLVVANTDGQSDTLTNAYTYLNPAPAVTGIAPSAGPASGGTSVTIVGANFRSGAAVSFGGTAATGVTVTSSTTITATTPAHAAATVNVVVTNSDSQSGTLANGYTYNPVVANPSLDLNVAPGWPGALTVNAGQNASYNLSIIGSGISGTVSLSCKGAPVGATCTTPASISVSSSAPTTFTITVTTTARTVGALHPPGSGPMPWGWGVTALGMVLWPGAIASKRSGRWSGRRYRRYLGLLPLALLLFTISCGGGGMGGSNPSGPQPTPNGTPAGTYTLTVTATSGSTTGTTPLTLTVK